MSYIVKNSGLFSQTILARGQAYFQSGKVVNLTRSANMVVAEVRGSRRYTVQCVFDGEKLKSYHCNCPYDFAGPCKHVAAVLFALDQHPFEEKNTPESVKPGSGLSYHLDQAKNMIRGMYLSRTQRSLLSEYGYFANDPVMVKDFWVYAFGEVLGGGSYAVRRLLTNFTDLVGLLKPEESLLIEAMGKAFELHRGGLDSFKVLDLLSFSGNRCNLPLQKALAALPLTAFRVSSYDPGLSANVIDSLIPEIYPLMVVLFPSAKEKLLDSAMDQVDSETFARMFLFYVQSGAFEPRFLRYLQALDVDLSAIYSAMFDLCYKARSLSYYLEIRDYIPDGMCRGKIIENLPKLHSEIIPYARVREGLPLTTPISKLNDLENLLLVYRYFPKNDLPAVDKKVQTKFEQLLKRSKASPELTEALMMLTDLQWPYLSKYLSDERLLSKRGQGCLLDQALSYAYVKTGRPEALGLKRIVLEGQDAH